MSLGPEFQEVILAWECFPCAAESCSEPEIFGEISRGVHGAFEDVNLSLRASTPIFLSTFSPCSQSLREKTGLKEKVAHHPIFVADSLRDFNNTWIDFAIDFRLC